MSDDERDIEAFESRPLANYRERARELRGVAATTESALDRKALLDDAELWERMANYLEKNRRG